MMYSDNEREVLRKQGVILTGFLSEPEYQTMMYYCDAVVVLTTAEYIVNCGAYEVLAFRKPYVVSDPETPGEFFQKGCV